MSSKERSLLYRLWNELTDPYGAEWGDDPRDKELIANCVAMIKYLLESTDEDDHG